MITFNGIYLKDHFSKIRTIQRPLIPEQIITTVEIPKRAGAYKVNRRDGIRVITVSVMTYDQDKELLQAKLDGVKPSLIVDEPAPLTFSDQPGKTYYAMISGDTDIDQLNMIAENQIKFICFDPYAYGELETFNTVSDTSIFNVAGNKETFPKYTFTFTADATAIGILKDGQILLVGIPENVESSTVNPKSLFLHDQCNSLTNWVASTSGIDGGVIAGSMGIQNGSSFYPASYGTGASWHGPAIHRDLTETLQDFEAEITLTQNNAFRDRVGREEIYFTDINDNVILKMAMKDISTGFSNNHGEVRLGTLQNGKYIVSRDSDNHGWWNNFTSGKFVFKREGRKITGRVARVDSEGQEFNIQFFEFYDKDDQYQQPLKRIRVHSGVSGTKGPTTQTMDDIKIYKLNVINEITVPLIAQTGDVITVDVSNGHVRKNGALYMVALNRLSEFFPLLPGSNEIEIVPSGKADAKIEWNPRWL